MREYFRSPAITLITIACLLMPAILSAADSSAPAADPTSAAAAAAPNTSGASVGTVITPTLVDLLVKKGVLTTSEANSLKNVSGSAGMDQLLLLLKAKGVVTATEAADL